MTLHFGCNPVELDQEQVLDYLHYLKTQSRTPSSSYFKHTVYGLRTYIEAERPYLWLFNGKDAHGQLQQFSATGVQWVISQAARKAGIQKHVTSHVLRHSYATHLLEMGMDIMTLKEVMGHEDIKSTLIYLHVARLGRNQSFSPLDKLYTREYKN